MTRIHSLLCAALAILALGAAGHIRGEEQSPIKLTLYPAGEPSPALKYRLLPGRLDQIPGNAAVYYGKVTAEERTFFGNRELLENIVRWQEMPLEQLRRDQIHLPSGGGIEFSIRRGARCKYCDWQLPIGDIPFYTTMLPELQQTREFGRILGARARLQIADRKYDDAIETLQAGYSLGRHAAAGETLVNGLVGIAICEIMSRQILELVQQQEAPNLYWALSMLPAPLVDMRDAVDVEAMSVELSFPELRDIRTAERTPDEWREFFHSFAKEVIEQISNVESPERHLPDQIEERCQQLLPDAKAALMADGIPADEVAAMPIHQVALLYTLRTYHELQDDAIKHYYLPYPQANAGIDSAIDRAKSQQREIIPLAARLVPAMRTARGATARNDRRIAVLRAIEAIRIYGDNHQGELPAQLSDITEVPIPDDPVTGKPIVYYCEAGKAHLQGPILHDEPLNYEITMVRPK